jgi:hypothetical protein
MLKLAGRWRGGNLSNVFRNSPTMACAGTSMNAVGHPLVVEIEPSIVAALEGIAAQVDDLGRPQRDIGSRQTPSPCARCSMKVTFQLSKRSA